jgi:predicted  nucleic acid-binding Zn-ribbon protein
MSHKHVISLAVLTFVLQACGDTKDEKNLKRRNKELSQQNTELAQEKDKILADRSAELAKAQQELDAAQQSLGKAKQDKEAAEKAKTALETKLAAQQKSATSLNEQLAAKENEISNKEIELASLRNSVANHSAEIQSLNEKIKTAEGEVKALTSERNTLKEKLAEADSANAAVKAELEAQLAAKDKLIKDKDAEIATLNVKVATLSSTPDLASAQVEITKLKEERDALNLAISQAESAAEKAKQDIAAANKKIAELEKNQTGILKKSLDDIRGLWLNQVKIPGIAGPSCYEFVHLAENGSFAQAVACGDGRVQIQKHSFDRMSAQAVPNQIDDNDYEGTYGFVVDGQAASSTCQDPAASLLKTGNRLVFEMTRQDFGRNNGNFISRNMLVSVETEFKGFTNAGLNFTSNQLDYTTMAAIAGRPGAGNLTKAAAAFLGGLEGKGANIQLGCFDSSGVFTAQSSN